MEFVTFWLVMIAIIKQLCFFEKRKEMCAIYYLKTPKLKCDKYINVYSVFDQWYFFCYGGHRKDYHTSICNKNLLVIISVWFYFSDKLFPALGFGARMSDGSVHHDFALVCFFLLVLSFVLCYEQLLTWLKTGIFTNNLHFKKACFVMISNISITSFLF